MMEHVTRLITRSLISVAVTGILCGNVFASDALHVSPSGIDSNGAFDNNCTDSGTPCKTIQHAIDRTRINNPINDTINLAGGIYSENGLVVTNELTIQAEDSNNMPTIDAQNISRHFDIATPGTVIMRDLNLINGNMSNVHEAGGSVKVSEGNLRFENVSASFNSTANNGGAIACILDCEELYLKDSTFKSNSARHGGAVSSIGKTTIDSSQFLDNTAEDLGGAIHKNSVADFTTMDSFSTQFTNNSAREGGAIYSAISTTNIYRSSFVGNESDNSGSAIWFGGLDDRSLLMISSTITRNVAGRGQVGAGAIYMHFSTGYWGNLAFADNDSWDDGRHVDANGSTIEMSNSYFYNSVLNQAAECNSDIEMIGVNNLWDDPLSNCFAPLSHVAPLSPKSLSPLGLFGPLGALDGTTLSYLLTKNSNAIDAAGICFHPALGNVELDFDQRGALRDDGACDIGATEK